ncbi:MAG TPA: PhoPQ-activated protein PqaA family protein [Candidatus Limnocylindria bacterium]|jgi:PhoPQ-activated pathogenicity-related protein|nr:PhoPQ-activated protein PqaA family protein [Candidatus Limnocylindria bacterium]
MLSPQNAWAILFALSITATSAVAGPLEDYVARPDGSFNWKRCEQEPIPHATLSHLELVSQTWQGQFWSHHLLVVRPEKVTHPDVALLFVTGGGYGAPDNKDAERFNLIAQRAGAVTALITKIPNQPLYDGRTEDALIAYTLDQYLKTGDKTWPLLFPMVKSAVRGMDTVQQFATKEWGQDIKHFVISGASKRGWTTWLTGATDPRVKAIAPMVIDMLNMKKQLGWAAQMYGKQSEEINDYTSLNLDTRDDASMNELRSWIDPYAYRARYTMPKLLLLGTNDPYWVVDSLRNYWDDLPAGKLVFQTPNAGHDLAGGKEAVTTLANWFALVAANQPLPEVNWTLRDGSNGPAGIDVSVNQTARKIRLWSAHSKDRDFRDDSWTSSELPLAADNQSAHANVEKPATGFTAFMAEVELPTSAGDTYKLSTRVQVVPDMVNHNP